MRSETKKIEEVEGAVSVEGRFTVVIVLHFFTFEIDRSKFVRVRRRFTGEEEIDRSSPLEIRLRDLPFTNTNTNDRVLIFR